MDIVVKLVVHRGEGALAKSAEALSADGFSFYDHSLKAIDEQRAELEIRASGIGDTNPLFTTLAALEPVEEVVEIRQLVTASETDDHESAQEMPDPWVERIAHDWPDIMDSLKEFSATVGESERVHRMTALGIGVGRALYQRRAPSTPPAGISDGLEHLVLPAIEAVARGKVRGHTLRVRETVFACGEMVDLMFTPVEEEGGYCCLLTGIISGMLNEVPRSTPIRVTETRCLAKGEPVCDFEVEEIPH
ncbi:MAG TPA: hypothetical protein VIT83_02745 [Gammaproteobacteria bacterium]